MRSRSALPWLAALLLAPAWAAQADEPAAAGDLVLGGDEALLVEDEELVVEGSITLAGSASLTLRRGDLDLRPPGGGVATITLRDQARLHLEDATVRGPDAVRILPAGEAAVELRSVAWRDAGEGAIRPADRATLRVEGSDLGDTGITLTGRATGALRDTTVRGGPGVNTWDQATLRIDGGSVNAMPWRGLGAYGASTLHMANATADGMGPVALDQATLIVEDSTLGTFVPGSTMGVFLQGDPAITWRNVTIRGLEYWAMDRGTFTFDRSPSMVRLEGGGTLRVLHGDALVYVGAAEAVEVGPGSSVTIFGPGAIANLFQAAGAEVGFYAGTVPVGASVGRFTNECLLGIPVVAERLPYVPSVPRIGQLTQHLRVRVEDAVGNPVPGTILSLAALTGEPTPVYDLATQAATPLRTADAAGQASYLFTPPGAYQVIATAPDGRTGSAIAVVASCADMLVVVG